jgi:beta-N-acetylhexosaminidase
MARAMAVEHRYFGLHWTFSPVIDPNLNFHNPITNTRSVGEHPDLVKRHVVPFIKGFQDDNVMAAAAKHFPGDGLDFRDQHLTTAVNHLPMAQWRETYGKIWQSAIDSGVMTVMPGHISLPDYQGFSDNPEKAPPATLSSRIQVELLREELGFQGVVISDATPMIGMTAWASNSERIVQNVLAGSDVYLFGDSGRDFNILMEAVNDGRLSEERVRQSARRVLELKARLGLDRDPFGPAPSESQKSAFAATARTLAESAITIIRDDGRPPVSLESGDRVLTITIKYDVPSVSPLDLEVVDEELSSRGFKVEHLLNPSNTEHAEQAPNYAAVFVNMHVSPDMRLGTLRLPGGIPVPQWMSLHREHPQVIYTTFGNPYTLYEMPQVNNLVATFGTSDESQKAAVRVWLGESEARGSLPFTQPEVSVRPIDLNDLNST